MADIKPSKELTSLIVVSVSIILIIGFYIIPQAPSLDETDNLTSLPETDNSNTEGGTQQEIIGFNGTKVGINGIEIQNNSIETNTQEIIESHTSYLDGKSRELISDKPNFKDVYKVFSDRVVVSRGQNRTPYVYEDGKYQYRRQSDGETNFYSVSDESLASTSYNIGDDIQLILASMTPDRLVNRSDGVVIQLSSDNVSEEFRDSYRVSSSVANSTIKISEKGYIKSYSVSFESGGIIPQVNRYKFTISQVESVDVNEPAWVQQARRSSLVANTSINEEKSWIKLEHLDFREVPKGSNLSILTSEGSVESKIPSRISPGDEIYIVAEDSKTWNVKTSRPEPGGLQFNNSEFLIEISDGDEIIYSELVQSTT